MSTIGSLAKTLGITVETIRFYERKGLVQQPPKPAQGYRNYTNDAAERIRFVKRAQELGFTLVEIKHLLSLEDSRCGEIQSLAERKLQTVQIKLRDLTRLESALQTLLSQCSENDDKSNCPIIDSLQPTAESE